MLSPTVRLATDLKGLQPYAGVISDASGNLYGTTYGGGKLSDGAVFEIRH